MSTGTLDPGSSVGTEGGAAGLVPPGAGVPAPGARPSGGSAALRLLRVLGLPVLLALVVFGVYRYVTTAQLDSIEARLLDPSRLVDQTLQHLKLVGVSTLVVVALAVPAGVLATRPSLRRVVPAIVGLGNIAQGVPSLGVVVLFAVSLGSIGFTPAIFALVLYAFLPVLRNTIVGLQQVDRFVVESARGMGMSRLTVLRRIELPLAVPVVLAGIRTAAVINVGTATIAALINAGGLGETIYQGLVLNRVTATVVGAILAGVLALLIDHLGSLLEQALRPKGL
ncbi:MAG TPA: ABC transporter permease [Mycobacteriales bacterium]|nr:ABC transporter permease [Mycobacteriales bacterium]